MSNCDTTRLGNDCAFYLVYWLQPHPFPLSHEVVNPFQCRTFEPCNSKTQQRNPVSATQLIDASCHTRSRSQFGKFGDSGNAFFLFFFFWNDDLFLCSPAKKITLNKFCILQFSSLPVPRHAAESSSAARTRLTLCAR